ncbi:MAG: Gfo/Idh/MocA family oxidoreductase [bacterium]|jgi:predicted dehydrogenase|nr:Gfo/Idh/MocA family oxidoreductase [bacterium]
MNDKQVSRRLFLVGSAATVAAAGCAAPGGSVKVRSTTQAKSGFKSPNEKLNMAAIGAGGKGSSDIQQCASLGENVIALADPDQKQAAGNFNRYADAKKYQDFRVMLDEMGDQIDACTISTPDHTHAVAAVACMERGIHVYVQKPLTKTIYEARYLTETARKYGVMTQMGNQGHSGDGVRDLCEIIWSGMIGDVTEIHAWTNRPVWPQGIKDPLPAEEVPENMNWDLWIGPAPFRPYNSKYAPFNWRGWWDFGCGALGDMACHILDPVNMSMQLGYPIAVECLMEDGNSEQTFPNKSIIRFTFPARPGFPQVDVYWYDGGLKPKMPEGVVEDYEMEACGSIYYGSKGIAASGEYGGGSRVIKGDAVGQKPAQMLPRLPGDGDDMKHKIDFIRACKTGVPAGSNFDYAGPFTEWVVMGNLSLKFPHEKLDWDGEAMRFTNKKEANDYVHYKYRKGWSL